VAQRVSPWFEAIVDMTEAGIDLARGDLEAVARWAQRAGLDPGDRPQVRRYQRHRLQVQLYLAQGHTQQTLTILKAMATEIEAVGAYGLLIEVLALKAVALHQLGKETEALSVLEHALRLAEPEGFVRVFVVQGNPMRRLLEAAQRRQIRPHYVALLLGAFEPSASAPAAEETGRVAPAQRMVAELIEPLTDRELEVLNLLALGLTNREIGERLYIAPGTVKAHTASVYGKLDVHSRMQAVARAQELGILSPPR
jgi:LuxR family maltose regulon positive regulatory protein